MLLVRVEQFFRINMHEDFFKFKFWVTVLAITKLMRFLK